MANLIDTLGGSIGFGENSLSRNDDGSSGFIDLTSVFENGLNFFGANYTGLYINTNGSITFDDPLSTFTPETISSGTNAGIFPFWADVDTSGGVTTPSPGGTSQGTNLIYYDLDPVLGTATITWDDVGFFSARTDVTNAFQLVLSDVSESVGRSDGDFLISFIYENIDWTTGDLSGGTNGLGGTVARAGYSAGNTDGTFYELPSSGDGDAMLALDSQPILEFLSTDGGVTTNLDLELPDTLSPGEQGTAELRGASDGFSAALVAVSADRGLVADPLSGGFSQTVFVLDRGQESGVDVTIKGSAGPRSTVVAAAQVADMEAFSEISNRITALQPSFTEASTVSRIENNLLAQFGDTIGSLTTTLVSHADHFASLGLNAESATAALAFATETAGDFGSLAERGKVGSLGQGWSSLADIGLDIDGTTVQMRGLVDFSALRALSVDASALYTVSNSAGRSVSLSGDALALGAPERPQFEQGIDGRFQTVSGFIGTLTATDTGFSLLTDNGETLEFDQDGNFLEMRLLDVLAIVAEHDAEMNITGFTGPNGGRLAYTRDSDGIVLSVEDEVGALADFSYNSDGKLETVTRAQGQSSFTYNSDGDLETATAPGNIEAEFAYDSFGRLANVDYGNGTQSETFTYDDAGGLIITDGAGRTTELDLLPGSVVGRVTDGLGGASEIIYNEDGSISGVRAPDGSETSFVFDDQGRLTEITDANGAVLGFTYGESGDDPTSFTDASGGTRSFEYDDGGRITEATWPDGTTLQFEYDAQGNLTGYTNRRGDDVDYTYDARGRLLSESDSSAGPTTYSYDNRGRLTSATNDQGTTSLAYDNADRVTQIDYPTGKSLIYTYNDAGLRASMSDGGNYNIFYEYDALGRLTGLRDEDSQIVVYQYDGAGNLVREENGNGTVSLFTYDAAGRLLRIENQAPDTSTNSFNDYSYDAAGLRITNQTQDGTWTYGYDAIGQLTSADFVSINPGIDDKSLVYEYDASGNRTRVVEDGVETLYTSNSLNQYTQVGDETFNYDADGNMTSRTGPNGTTSYTYDLDSRLTSVTESDGTVLEFEYDVFGNRVVKTVDGTETEYLVDPFGLGDVVSEFTGGSLSATYAHGLGLAAGEIGGFDAFFDADAVGTVTTLTGVGGVVENSYVFTPFGSELFEGEDLANDFEFNGVLGVAEDSEDLTFMRARSYSDTLGRFLSEDPLWASGAAANLHVFSLNSPLMAADPSGENPFIGILAGLLLAKGSYDLTNAAADYAKYQDREAATDIAIAAAGLVPGPTGNVVGDAIIGGVLGQGADALTGSGRDPALVARVEGRSYIRPYDLQNAVTEPQTEAGRSNYYRILAEYHADRGESFIPPVDLDAPFNPPVQENPVDFPETPEDAFSPPSTDSTGVSSSPGDGRSDGDPHLSTFDGVGYSFQAVGEFTLVIGDGFEIQTRQVPLGNSGSVSVNEAVAMRIDDDNVISVYANEYIPLVVNGTAVVMQPDETIAVGNGSVYFDGRVYIIMDENGNGVWARLGGSFLNIRTFVSDDPTITGLLGNNNGDRSDDFMLRDGTLLSQPLPETVLYGEYADSWRVTQDSSLFLYRDGESTETFTDRGFPTNIVRLDDLDPDVRMAAEAVAIANGLTPGTFEFETTVLDIAVSGNEEFAVGVGAAPTFQDPGEEVEIQEVQINEAPDAATDTAIVDEEGSVLIDVLANDSDPEGDALSLVGGSDPNGGTVTVENGQLRFNPAQDFFGSAELSYQLDDAGGNSVFGLINATVNNLPDAPVAADDGFTTDSQTPITTGSVFANDVDVDGDTLQILSIDTSGMQGLLTNNGDGTFDYDPNGAFDALDDGESAVETFTYTVDDGTGRTSTATVSIQVNGVDETLIDTAPTDITLSNTSVQENSNLNTVLGSIFVTDINPGDTHNLTLVDSAGGLFTLQGSNLVTAGNLDFEAATLHSIIVRATDTSSLIFDKEFQISVLDVAETFVGTEDDDVIVGDAGDNDIQGLSGNDDITPGLGQDNITLGTGRDTLSGSSSDFDGDTVTDFGNDDVIIFTDQSFTRSHFTVTQGSAIIAVDADENGTPEATFTLDGDYTDGGFMASRVGNDTIISFENYMISLNEGVSVEATLINGIMNNSYLSGTNMSGMSVTFEANAQATFNNTVGLYEVDSSGNLANVQILAQNAKQGGTVNISGIDPNNSVGFFLVQDGDRKISDAAFERDNFSFIDNGSGGFDLADSGSAINGVNVFFSHDASLNPDNQVHVVSGVSNDREGAMRIGFEDLLRNGRSDDDFQDVLLYVDVV